MRANDIELLRNVNVPRELIYVLRAMHEDQEAMKQQMMTLAGLFDRMMNTLGQHSAVMGKLQQLAPHIQALRQQGMEVGSDPTLAGMPGEDDDGR